jgi:hypothetical protein
MKHLIHYPMMEEKEEEMTAKRKRMRILRNLDVLPSTLMMSFGVSNVQYPV